MSFKAITNKDTQIVSVRHPPVDVPKGTPITVWDEAGGWGLVDAVIRGKMVTGEMPSSDYDRVTPARKKAKRPAARKKTKNKRKKKRSG